MHLVLFVLVALPLVGQVASQTLPGVSCAAGYSSTTQTCPTSNEADCVASTCTTAGNFYSQCQTVNGQLYCAVCCPNTDYFVWPDANRLNQGFNIGDSVDTIYAAETAAPSGVSTNCTCNNPTGYFFWDFQNNVQYGAWEGYVEWGTQTQFNQDLQQYCSSYTTQCFFTLHQLDGGGPSGFGSPLAYSNAFTLFYNSGGSEQGVLPAPIAAPSSSPSQAPPPTTVVIPPTAQPVIISLSVVTPSTTLPPPPTIESAPPVVITTTTDAPPTTQAQSSPAANPTTEAFSPSAPQLSPIPSISANNPASASSDTGGGGGGAEGTTTFSVGGGTTTSPTVSLSLFTTQSIIPILSVLSTGTTLQTITVAQTTILATGTATLSPAVPIQQVPTTSLGAGPIAGIVVGAIIGLVLLILGMFLLWRMHKRGRTDEAVFVTSGFTPSAYKPGGVISDGTARAFGNSPVYEADGGFGRQGGMSPQVSEMNGSVPGSPTFIKTRPWGRNF